MRSHEPLRQGIHLVAGTVLLLGYAQGILGWPAFAGLLVASLFCLLALHAFGSARAERLLRRYERPEAYLPGWGAISVIGGFLASSLLFERRIAIIALIVLVYGDAAATLAGQGLWRNPLCWNKKKSWQGLITGFLVSATISALYVNLAAGLVASATGMLAESLNKPQWLDDNLYVPLLAGLAATILL